MSKSQLARSLLRCRPRTFVRMRTARVNGVQYKWPHPPIAPDPCRTLGFQPPLYAYPILFPQTIYIPCTVITPSVFQARAEHGFFPMVLFTCICRPLSHQQ